jgi:hypothetical protein
MTYRTDVTKARKRAEVALVALRRSELSPLADLAGDLSRWLAAFDARSLLELDYDGVSGLFSWDELDNDRSAAEVQESVKALARAISGAPSSCTSRCPTDGPRCRPRVAQLTRGCLRPSGTHQCAVLSLALSFTDRHNRGR